MLSSIEERLPISSQCPPSTAIACAAERQAALTAVRRGTLRRALPIKGLSSPSRHVHPRARANTPLPRSKYGPARRVHHAQPSVSSDLTSLTVRESRSWQSRHSPPRP